MWELSQAVKDVLAERQAQVTEHGNDAEHDDQHTTGELALAAASYAFASTISTEEVQAHTSAIYGQKRGCFSVIAFLWPWPAYQFRARKGPRRMLVKAAAMLIAEIERWDRAAARREAKHA